MTDEKFAEFIKKTAQDYNRPPEAPRAEMWARIDEVRAKRRGERELERQARPWLRWGFAAAAVLAVGIGIGRVTVPENDGATSTVAAATADVGGGDPMGSCSRLRQRNTWRARMHSSLCFARRQDPERPTSRWPIGHAIC